MNTRHVSSPTIPFLLLALLVCVAPLGACGTMAGAGSDISKGGKALENSANKHAP